MLSAHRLEQLLARIKALPRPVVSIYAASGQAGVHRVLTELRAADPAIAGSLEARIFAAIGHPGGCGTVAIFAGPAGAAQAEIITRNLPCSLPVGSNELAGEGRVGEPWLIPLRLALSQTRRVALVHVHDQGVSAHESFLDEIEQIVELTSPTLPAADGYDDAEAQRLLWRRRFYVDAAAELVPLLAARSIDAVLLLGTPQNRQLFTTVAPAMLLDKVIGTRPGLPQQSARPAQILAAVRDELDEHLRQRKLDLLAKLHEHGVIGLDDCLSKLQRGQLQLLFVPWDLECELFVEFETGQVASSPGQARALGGASNARVAPVPARSKLIELADLHSTEIEFVRAGSASSPFDEIGGVAGLPRWT